MKKEDLKKVLLFAGLFVLISGLAIGIGFTVWHFTKPNNFNMNLFGSYRIRMMNWTNPSEQQYIRWATESLPELNRLGPRFEIVNENEDIRVYRGELTCNTQGAAIYQSDGTGQRRIVIDPTCVHGELEFRAGFMHEIGHSLGMMHVCRPFETSRNDCSPVGTGIAVMNPNILYGSAEATDFSTATWQIQSLDILEFCRARGSCVRRNQ